MKFLEKKNIIIIAGPTASGKTQLAIDIAKKLDGVIINCDSVQLYKSIPILSAQPTLEMRNIVPHKLYGILPSEENPSAGKFLAMVKDEIDEVHSKNKIAIIVGGTGMYIKMITDGISNIPDIPENIRLNTRNTYKQIGNEKFFELLKAKDKYVVEKININDSQRLIRAAEVLEATGKSISYWHGLGNKKYYNDDQIFIVSLLPNRKILYEKCNLRFENMIKLGAIEEIRNLMSEKYTDHITKTIGMIEIMSYIGGTISINDAISKAQQNTRNYAKRQYTWFRNQLKNSYQIHFEDNEDLKLRIKNILV